MSQAILLESGAAALLDALHGAGYAAYAVGGCVRDSLLGQMPHDWDLCTSARPEQMMELFGAQRCILTGLKHGTVTVKCDGRLYEITTFRTEASYSDGRHPDRVEFVPDVRADLARRDFTINAMAYNKEEGLIDPFGGQEDLLVGQVVRAVGQPEQRFAEDGLRILRLYRFAARFGFGIDPATAAAARALAEKLTCVSAERIQEELCRLLCAPRPGAWLEPELLAQILPELEPLSRPAQLETIRRRIDALPPELPLRLAALLSPLGETSAQTVLRRLRCSNALTAQVAMLVREQELVPQQEPEARRIQALRLLGQFGAQAVRSLTLLCETVRPEQVPAFAALRAEAGALAQQDACCRVGQLEVNGRDLLKLGIPAGPGLRRTLDALLEQVITGQTPNQREALLAAARVCIKGSSPKGE
ncbi:MAG: CCA tRNA nucleotidyltransferase [Faecalibacterium sp.]